MQCESERIREPKMRRKQRCCLQLLLDKLPENQDDNLKAEMKESSKKSKKFEGRKKTRSQLPT
jgi:hypothetical protein